MPSSCPHERDHRYRANNDRNISAPLHTALNPSRELAFSEPRRRHSRTLLIKRIGMLVFSVKYASGMEISPGASNTRMTVICGSKTGSEPHASVGKYGSENAVEIGSQKEELAANPA